MIQIYRNAVEASANALPTRRSCLALAGLGALAACGANNPLSSGGKLYRMGDKVATGPLIYTVLETHWLSSLGSRLPKNKFLSIRVTILNSGNRERAVPLLTLIDPKGTEIIELSEGEGLDEWLGVLRNLAATETVQGQLLFDVPQSAYKLQVTDGGEPGSEVTALVDIPLRIDEKTQITTPGGDKGPE